MSAIKTAIGMFLLKRFVLYMKSIIGEPLFWVIASIIVGLVILGIIGMVIEERDRLIKPMQSRGLWGPRHICKKVLELPIPKFDAKNPIHHQISGLGKECSRKVEGWLKSGSMGKIISIGKLRSMVRETLKDELLGINTLVKEILE